MGEGEAKVQEEVQGGEGVVSGGCGKVAPPSKSQRQIQNNQIQVYNKTMVCRAAENGVACGRECGRECGRQCCVVRQVVV